MGLRDRRALSVRRSLLYQSQLLERDIFLRWGNDYMVFDIYPYQVSYVPEPVRKGYIVVARCRVSRRVIVGQDDTVSALEDRGLEYLPRVHYGGCFDCR